MYKNKEIELFYQFNFFIFNGKSLTNNLTTSSLEKQCNIKVF